MNIYVINPEHLKIETFHSLCEILKVSYIYNLIKDDYIDSYISGSECNIDFNIRKLKAINDNSWKKGVYAFLDRISIPIFENQSLVGRELKDEMIDIEHSKSDPIYNILNSNASHVMVLQNNMCLPYNETLNQMCMNDYDFVDYAQKIILKYTNIGKQINHAIVGVCIDEFLFARYRHSFTYAVKFYTSGKLHHTEWRNDRFRSKKTKRTVYHIDGYIKKSFREKLYPDSESKSNLLPELLTEEGFLRLKKFIKSYRDFLYEEEERWRREEEAREVDDWAEWNIRESNEEFRSMMDDCDAWGNID